jgi:hypothetical protein
MAVNSLFMGSCSSIGVVGKRAAASARVRIMQADATVRTACHQRANTAGG